MSNFERTGYRDLIFSQWHRLIPHLKMIDVDVLQCCKVCSKPLLLAEITRQNTVKPTSILRKASEHMGVQGVLINFYTRNPKDGLDKTHEQYLARIREVENQIKKLTKEKTDLVNGMYRYCADRFGEKYAYDSAISLIGFQKVYPEKSEYKVLDSTYQIKVAFEQYRYCSTECQDKDESKSNPFPIMDKPPYYSMGQSIKKKLKSQLVLGL